jgi:hypothetical protein
MTTPTVTDEQIIAAYLKPMTIKDVARDLDISRYRVEQVLAAADIVRRHGAFATKRLPWMIALPADTLVKPSLPSERKVVAPVPLVDYPHIRSVNGAFTCRCGVVSRPGAAESLRALDWRWGKFTREHRGCR